MVDRGGEYQVRHQGASKGMVVETMLRYLADPAKSKKTGWYYLQRDNIGLSHKSLDRREEGLSFDLQVFCSEKDLLLNASLLFSLSCAGGLHRAGGLCLLCR